MAESPGDVTRLLQAWGNGDQEALNKLLPHIYDELRRLAGSQLRREGSPHTLQPTALVHEAYLRLAGQDRTRWQNRAHFLGVAAQAMRRILIDHARAGHAAKRGGDVVKVALDDVEAGQSSGETDLDLVALDAALTRLAAIDPQKSRIVELRFFGGLSVDEVAEVLNLSPRTVARQWQMARAWLYGEIAPGP
ncbi:MAG: sigma-70 family RNA polymerase sigma factor [Acidobacteria bacterium]|nr:sigma-70 family RNA polymerase sigma factor [Acidobacteriota bacterium]